MAPEYVQKGHFTVKSDVFSFGVLILEIISGQKQSCFRFGEEGDDLLSYVSKNIYLQFFSLIARDGHEIGKPFN